MKLYKFRPLADCNDLERIECIINSGFYCCDFLNFNDMNEGVFSANQKNKKITLDQKLQYKVCSFSGKNALNNQLMWGHYANAGMGIVIEVEVNNCKNIKEVVYNDKYDALDSIEGILTHKTTEWEYENEFRCIIDSSECTRKIGNITKIYFGTPYKELENYGEIEEQHKKLKKYLECKQKLEEICKKQHPKITNCDYKFTYDLENNKMAHSNAGRHTFSFEGGDQLTTIGATFFVSYLYCLHVDSSHRNWESIKTKKSRISTLNRSEGYHRAWLNHIGNMSEANLNRNTLGLDGSAVKKMALAIQKAL